MQTPPPVSSTPAPAGSRFDHKRLIIVLSILAGLLVFGELWRRISQASELRGLESHIGAQVTQLASESNRLQTEIAGAQSDEDVARWARGEGKMVLPGEVLVVPLTPAAIAQPTSAPEPVRDSLPNWRIWLEWLWGS